MKAVKLQFVGEPTTELLFGLWLKTGANEESATDLGVARFQKMPAEGDTLMHAGAKFRIVSRAVFQEDPVARTIKGIMIVKPAR